MMNLPACITAGTIILTAGLLANSVFAQNGNERSVDQYACKDIMRQSGADRDASIAFIHGYVLGKAGSTSFNVEMLEKQTDAFISQCLDNPNDKALDAMMKVKN